MALSLGSEKITSIIFSPFQMAKRNGGCSTFRNASQLLRFGSDESSGGVCALGEGSAPVPYSQDPTPHWKDSGWCTVLGPTLRWHAEPTGLGTGTWCCCVRRPAVKGNWGEQQSPL